MSLKTKTHTNFPTKPMIFSPLPLHTLSIYDILPTPFTHSLHLSFSTKAPTIHITTTTDSSNFAVQLLFTDFTENQSRKHIEDQQCNICSGMHIVGS